MHLALVIAELGAGGAERVLTTLANEWAAQGQQITILTLDDGAKPPFFTLNPRIQHQALALIRPSRHPLVGLVRNLLRVRALRRILVVCRPQLVISFMDQTNVLTLCASFGLALPVVVTEHTDPVHACIPRPWKLLRWLTYPWAARLVVLNPSALNYFSHRLRNHAHIIPNPVVVPAGTLLCRRTASRTRPILLAMGRLVELKGFDRLLHAWAQIAPQHPDWSLEIWGEGPLRPTLEALAQQLAVGDQVHLPGLTREPFRTMQDADLFVVTSHYEGFSLVLAEAMACGLPVVSFDCPSGPRELIRHGIDGMLVPNGDVDVLAKTLDQLMGNPSARQELAAHAPEVLERFGLDRIMQLWEALVEELVGP